VEIKEMNYYLIAKGTEKYDVIIFSSSFMLMPYREKALEIARDHLTPNGRIFFLMTLYTHKGFLQNMMVYIKPYLKYLTTIDFGQVTYQDEFEKMISDAKLKITSKEVLKSKNNVFYNTFRMNVIEAMAN